jgi:hypothetical protein
VISSLVGAMVEVLDAGASSGHQDDARAAAHDAGRLPRATRMTPGQVLGGQRSD